MLSRSTFSQSIRLTIERYPEEAGCISPLDLQAFLEGDDDSLSINANLFPY